MTQLLNIKKAFVTILLAIAACFITVTMNPVMTYAYTQEQVAQAKAWLSAHGYAPTRAGAAQAYADYKNGKWTDSGEENTSSVDVSDDDEDASDSKGQEATETKAKTDEKTIESIAAFGETETTEKKEKETTTEKSKEQVAKEKKEQKEKVTKQKKEDKKHKIIIVSVVALGVIFVVIMTVFLKKKMR